MSPRTETLAQALYDATGKGPGWTVLPEDVQEPWRITADALLLTLDSLPPDDDEQPTIHDALATLAAGAAQLDRALFTELSETPWVDALHRLRDLRRTTQSLGRSDAAMVRHAYLTGEHGKRVLDGLGEVYVGRGRAREKWQGEAAVREYVDHQITELGGEFPDPSEVIRWVLEVVPVTESTKLRTTPLKAAGLDPDDYRHSEPGTLSVSLPPA